MQTKLTLTQLGKLNLPYALTLLIIPLVVGLSLAGLLQPAVRYPSPNARTSYLANDLVNLLLGLPLLVISAGLVRRGRTSGLLVWPGALLYTLYNYLAYALGLECSGMTLLYAAVAALCLVSITLLVRSIDGERLQHQTAGMVSHRLSGWLFAMMGTLFYLRAVLQIRQGYLQPDVLSGPERGVLAADLVMSAAWLVGGIQILQGSPLGFALGPGLSTATSALFLGVILVVLINPLVSRVSLDREAVLILAAMSLVPLWINTQYLKNTLQGIHHDR